MVDEDENKSGAHRSLLGIMAVAAFVSVLNTSMVNVAIPHIGADLNVAPGRVGWIITGYSLVFAVGTALYGRLSDFLSLRRTFLLALVVFALGSLVCAMAQTLSVLVAGRAVQAMGGAAVPALAFGSVAKLFPSDRQGAAFGILASSVGVGAAAGPIVGGLGVSGAGWQVLFLGTLVLLVLLFTAAWHLMPDNRPESPDIRMWRTFDIPGGALIALSAGGTLLGITEIQQVGLTDWWAWLPLLSGAVFAGLFAQHIRQSPTPFAPPELFANRSFMAASAVALLAQGAYLGGGLFLIPLLLVDEVGLSAIQVGFVMLPSALAVAVCSPVAGRLSDRFGPKPILFAGLLALFSGLMELSSYAVGRSPFAIALALLVMGIGYAGITSPAATAASSALRRDIAGVGFGIYQLFFFLGAGAGATVVSAFLAFRRASGEGALNPIYTGTDASAFSDAFLLASLFVLVALGAVTLLGNRTRGRVNGY